MNYFQFAKAVAQHLDTDMMLLQFFKSQGWVSMQHRGAGFVCHCYQKTENIGVRGQFILGGTHILGSVLPESWIHCPSGGLVHFLPRPKFVLYSSIGLGGSWDPTSTPGKINWRAKKKQKQNLPEFLHWQFFCFGGGGGTALSHTMTKKIIIMMVIIMIIIIIMMMMMMIMINDNDNDDNNDNNMIMIIITINGSYSI